MVCKLPNIHRAAIKEAFTTPTSQTNSVIPLISLCCLEYCVQKRYTPHQTLSYCFCQIKKQYHQVTVYSLTTELCYWLSQYSLQRMLKESSTHILLMGPVDVESQPLSIFSQLDDVENHLRHGILLEGWEP